MSGSVTSEFIVGEIVNGRRNERRSGIDQEKFKQQYFSFPTTTAASEVCSCELLELRSSLHEL